MRNRDWVELLSTLGHDTTLPFESAPSACAKVTSVPFVFVGDHLVAGPARDLLGKMINAMGIRAESLQIIDINAAQNALPHLGPQWIIALGPEAAKLLIDVDGSLDQLRGRLHDGAGSAQVLSTYHPSYLMNHPDAKKACWEDLQIVMHAAGLAR